MRLEILWPTYEPYVQAVHSCLHCVNYIILYLSYQVGLL